MIKDKMEKYLNEAAAIADSTIKKIAQMTDNNYHTEAVLVLAKAMGDKDSISMLTHLKAAYKEMGHVPSVAITFRTAIMEDLLTKAKSKMKKEDLDKIHGAF